MEGQRYKMSDEPVSSREEQPKVQIESGFEIYLIKEEEVEETSLQQDDVCCSSKNASDDLDCQEKISESQLSEDGCLEVDSEGASEGEHLEKEDHDDSKSGWLPVLEGISAVSQDSSHVLHSMENSSQSERELDESMNDPTNSPPTLDEDSTGKQGFDCTKCKKRFSVESDLGSHVMTCCGNLSTQCPVCKKIFTSKSYLGKHMRLHTGEKPFECGECGMRFTMKQHLVYHQRTHTCEKPFKCTECGKGFITKSVLKVHFRRHGGNEPFQCSYCSRKLNSKNHLMTHERTHTGEKPHPCSSCSKRYSRKHQLLIHERKVHLKAKSPETSKDSNDGSAVSFQKDHDKRNTCSDKSSYQCPECNRKFKTKMSFAQHMKEHTGDKIYQCGECKKGFTSESGLKRHMRIHTVVEDQITTFLEMESHQISSLQMEVQRLREDLRQEKADKAALKDEVIWLKLYIVDHCLKEKRGQSHRTNDTPFLEVGSFDTEEDTSKDLPALPQPPPSVPTRATPQTSKTKASPSSSQEAVPQTPPSAPTPATPQTSKTKASPSNQEDQETKLLVNDPSDPNRYAHIRVSRVGYRTMVHKASRAKDGAKKLMNDALDLVFSREQLAASSGMGLRKEKDAGATGPHPLDAVKIAAILDFTKSFSKSQGWALPMDKELRRIVTNKVTNARRK